MSALMIFVVLVVVAVFFAAPRTAPIWLGLQALALAWHVAAHHGLSSPHALVSLGEILLIRGLLAPWLLSRASQADEGVDHLLPSNMFAWLLGVSLVVLAFQFGGAGTRGEVALVMGGVAASVLLALLLLSFNEAGTAQLFALLLVENAALLFESTLPEPWSPWVHAALTGVYLATVWVGVRLLARASEEASAEVSRQVL